MPLSIFDARSGGGRVLHPFNYCDRFTRSPPPAQSLQFDQILERSNVGKDEVRSRYRIIQREGTVEIVVDHTSVASETEASKGFLERKLADLAVRSVLLPIKLVVGLPKRLA